MIVVSDSSPLITLAASGHLRLLHALYGTVLIPEAVYRAEAITLALERRADLVLLDERSGRRRAAALGLSYTGVVGVLLEARKRGLLKAVRPVLDELRALGFWLSEAVYERALEVAGESS